MYITIKRKETRIAWLNAYTEHREENYSRDTLEGNHDSQIRIKGPDVYRKLISNISMV